MSFVSRLRHLVSGRVASRTTSAGADQPPATTPTTTGDPVRYDPRPDGNPDPGEVVWGWVPFEDDPTQGKDRPILLIGFAEEHWLGLMLTSQDHDRDAAQEARYGRHWMDVGSGGWDREGRPSEVRLDRLLVLEPGDLRREGAALDRATFEAVVAAAREFHALPG